ncbi:MAG: DUF1501 domain-containing protein [Vicinamibacterales bacterium]
MQTRRVFLKHSAATFVGLTFAPEFLTRAAAAAPTARGKVLVAVFQRGAVDGLNMVVPFGDRAYYAARPTIAIPQPGRRGGQEGAVDLDGFFGLHPRMAPLQPFYERRELAIVHACGSPDSTRSHFDAQDYMESGTPGVKSTDTGWLNRCLHAQAHADATPFRAVSLTPLMPRSLQGSSPVVAVSQIDRFDIRGPAGVTPSATFEAQYASAADVVLNRTGKEAFEALRMLREADPARQTPRNGAAYPRSAFGDAMRQIAQLIRADVGLEIAFAESTQWDHHVNEGSTTGQIAQRLDDFARGLAAFAIDLGDRLADVVVLTMSEFGRAVAENGNRGTDHGHGNAMMVLGGGVKGGRVYGDWPGLDVDERYERRDLAVTTDFRDVFAEVAATQLGLRDLGAVFPGYASTPARWRRFMA